MSVLRWCIIQVSSYLQSSPSQDQHQDLKSKTIPRSKPYQLTRHNIPHSLVPPFVKHRTANIHFSLLKIAFVAITTIGLLGLLDAGGIEIVNGIHSEYQLVPDGFLQLRHPSIQLPIRQHLARWQRHIPRRGSQPEFSLRCQPARYMAKWREL